MKEIDFDLSYKEIYHFFLYAYKDFGKEGFPKALELDCKGGKDERLESLFETTGKSLDTSAFLIDLLHKTHLLLDCGKKIKDYRKEDAYTIIKLCKSKRNTVNCLCHAKVLQSILQSLGMYARLVRCLPLDIHYRECHVITEVYVPEKRKWVFLDSANDVCFMNKAGDLASILEIRNHLINNEMEVKIICGNTWETPYRQYSLDYYKTHLMKNFIRFSSPLSGKTLDEEVLTLVPVNYYTAKSLPFYIKRICNGKVIVQKEHITTNTEQFWANPF